MGLLDAKDLSGFNLGKAAFLDDTVDLERQSRFEELLFGMGQSKVGENIPTPFGCRDRFFRSRSHAIYAFLCGDVPPQPAGVG